MGSRESGSGKQCGQSPAPLILPQACPRVTHVFPRSFLSCTLRPAPPPLPRLRGSSLHSHPQGLTEGARPASPLRGQELAGVGGGQSKRAQRRVGSRTGLWPR